MKKSIIFLGMLSISMAYAQQNTSGKIGVNTETPTETFDVKGTAKIQELPESGVGKIYNGTVNKNTTFTGTKTVVADDNGVLGVLNFVGGLKIQVVNLSRLSNSVIPASTSIIYKTSLSVQVPPGKWLYYVTLGVIQDIANNKGGSNFVRLRFLEHGESNNGAATLNNANRLSNYKFASYYISQGIGFNGNKGQVSGFLGINNNTNETRTFYLYADNQASNDGSGEGKGARTTLAFNWNESSIIRIPVID